MVLSALWLLGSLDRPFKAPFSLSLSPLVSEFFRCKKLGL